MAQRFERRWPMRPQPSWILEKRSASLSALMALGLVLGSGATLAQEKGTTKPTTPTVLKLTTPASPVRLLGARCLTTCWFSGLFAPAVVREDVNAIPVINTSKDAVMLKATFVPTNGLAMAQKGLYLILQQGSEGNDLLSGESLKLESGDTAQLKIKLMSKRLPAGAYTGQVQFVASASNADPITQITAIEVRIRDSAFWALLTIVLGITLGRLAQLVYDPKLMARVQLLDWLNELQARFAKLPDAAKVPLAPQLASLEAQLLSRGADPAALTPAFQALERQIADAETAAGRTVLKTAIPSSQITSARWPRVAATANWFACALRVLAGVTPLPLASVHNWLLPIFVFLTLVALTVVFMLQQYGGTGTAETFGAGGLADYAALFLAGVASEAIAGGLRAVKWR